MDDGEYLKRTLLRRKTACEALLAGHMEGIREVFVLCPALNDGRAVDLGDLVRTQGGNDDVQRASPPCRKPEYTVAEIAALVGREGQQVRTWLKTVGCVSAQGKEIAVDLSTVRKLIDVVPVSWRPALRELVDQGDTSATVVESPSM